ncbi:MAG: NUDIX domain-containing protein [Bacteroidales bacterium]
MKKFYEKGRFVIRVYGILINSVNEVLLSDEYRYKMKMTKFPGGGLKYGEGPEDCLLRESIEEFGQPAEIESHFYTTGFYQKALFYDDHQLISIYYKIKIPQKIKFKTSLIPFDFPILTEGAQSFRWQRLDSLKEGDLSFPVDKYVSEMLTRQFRNSQET